MFSFQKLSPNSVAQRVRVVSTPLSTPKPFRNIWIHCVWKPIFFRYPKDVTKGEVFDL